MDPLNMGGLDGDVIAEAVASRPGKEKRESAASKVRADTAAKKEDRLSTARAPPPPPPVAPEPEKPVDKSVLLDKLGAYRERFPELKSRNKVSARSSAEEIEDEIHYIEKQLGGKDMSLGMTLLIAAMAGLEEVHKTFNPLGLNLTGLTQVSKQNADEFTPIIDELMIKYGVGMSLGPEARLALAVGTMVYTVHAANSGDPRVAAAMAVMQKPKVPTVNDL